MSAIHDKTLLFKTLLSTCVPSTTTFVCRCGCSYLEVLLTLTFQLRLVAAYRRNRTVPECHIGRLPADVLHIILNMWRQSGGPWLSAEAKMQLILKKTKLRLENERKQAPARPTSVEEFTPLSFEI